MSSEFNKNSRRENVFVVRARFQPFTFVISEFMIQIKKHTETEERLRITNDWMKQKES